jgi:hypothetical protein
VRIVVRGEHLPGRRFEEHDDVHVGVQVGAEPVGLVPGDADAAEWAVDVRTVVGPDGAVDFRGPAVHGTRGQRFLYLTWGDTAGGRFAMFRRAKLVLDAVDPSLVAAAADPDGAALVATVDLTDGRGGPRCARVDPPALRWTVERAGTR